MTNRHKAFIITGFIIHSLLICDGQANPSQTEEIGTASHSTRIVNIVNFIRQCEPRIKWITEGV